MQTVEGQCYLSKQGVGSNNRAAAITEQPAGARPCEMPFKYQLSKVLTTTKHGCLAKLYGASLRPITTERGPPSHCINSSRPRQAARAQRGVHLLLTPSVQQMMQSQS